MTSTTEPGRPDAVDVSVLVAVAPPHYARLPTQLRCLLDQHTSRRVEILVADNGGHLDQVDLVGIGVEGEVLVVDASARRGAAFARNRAADVARGDALLFCDADDVVGPGWIDAHADALAGSDLTVGPTIPLPATGAEVDASIVDWASDRFRDRPIRHEGIDVGDSANLGVRRSVFVGVGGFPEAYLRSQDVALTLRLRHEGVTPTFVPGARVAVAVADRRSVDELRVRFHAGRARVMIARDFAVPARPWILAPRAAARALRAPFRGVARRGRRRSITGEVAELGGIVRELVAAHPGRDDDRAMA